MSAKSSAKYAPSDASVQIILLQDKALVLENDDSSSFLSITAKREYMATCRMSGSTTHLSKNEGGHSV